jgi:hypothetical protein
VQLGSLDMVVSSRNEQRQRREVPDDLLAGTGFVEALQQFLQDQTGTVDSARLECPPQFVDFGQRRTSFLEVRGRTCPASAYFISRYCWSPSQSSFLIL